MRALLRVWWRWGFGRAAVRAGALGEWGVERQSHGPERSEVLRAVADPGTISHTRHH